MIGLSSLTIGVYGLLVTLPEPQCETVAYRYYSCGKGGTCRESICLDNYHIEKNNDKQFPDNHVDIIGQNRITTANIIFAKILDKNYVGVL